LSEEQVALSIKIPVSLDKRLTAFILQRAQLSGFQISKSQLVRQLLIEALDNRGSTSGSKFKENG